MAEPPPAVPGDEPPPAVPGDEPPPTVPGDEPPPTVPGDEKDWTWVLDRPCPECGFVAAEVAASDVAARLRANATEWVALLDADPEGVRHRADPTVWSPLEYACHVRDVYRIYHGRLDRMLAEDDPHYANWDQDATAVEERYDLADPAAVAVELTREVELLAALFDTVDGDQWARTGVRSDGARFTIDTFSRYLLHDPVHHLHDVRGR